MTDYFSSLVDRATGASPVLERRRGSIFEPQPGTTTKAPSLAPFEMRADEPPETRFARSQSLFAPRRDTRVAPSSAPSERRPDDPPEVRIAENFEVPKSPLASRHLAALEEATETPVRRELAPSARRMAPPASPQMPPLEHRESRATAIPSAETNPTDEPAHLSDMKATLVPPKDKSAKNEANRDPTPLEGAKETLIRRGVTPSARVIETFTERTVERIRVDDPPAPRKPASASLLPGAPFRGQLDVAPTRPVRQLETMPQKAVVSVKPRAFGPRNDLEYEPPLRPKVTEQGSLRPRSLAPQAVSPAQSSQVRETSLPAPTIQVTIGRIEIRATPPPPAPAPATRPAAPKLSLDDYLRSRNGGSK